MSCSPVLRRIEQNPATARSPRHPWPDAIKPSGAAAPPTRGPVTPTGRTASSRGLPKDHPSTAPWPPHCSSPSQEYQPVRGSSPHRRPTSPADHRACLNPQPGARRIRRSVRSDGVGHDRQRGTITVDLRMRGVVRPAPKMTADARSRGRTGGPDRPSPGHRPGTARTGKAWAQPARAAAERAAGPGPAAHASASKPWLACTTAEETPRPETGAPASAPTSIAGPAANGCLPILAHRSPEITTGK
jgi:hypothetical protein